MGISSKMPSQRQLRVGEQIRHILAESLQRGSFYDEALSDISRISVTEVRCSPDLKNATAYVVALGAEISEETLEALNNAAPQMQKDINRHSNLKFTPRLRFKLDNSFENASRIEDLLRDINKQSSPDKDE